jgi:hypothetical protein
VLCQKREGGEDMNERTALKARESGTVGVVVCLRYEEDLFGDGEVAFYFLLFFFFAIVIVIVC